MSKEKNVNPEGFKPMLPKDFDPSKITFSYRKDMPSGAKLFFLEYDGERDLFGDLTGRLCGHPVEKS